MKKLLWLSLTMFMVGSYLNAGTISRTSPSKSTGDTYTAAELNGDLDTLYGEINGNLDSNNLENNAVTTDKITNDAVTPSKIDDDNITPVTVRELAVTTGVTASTMTTTSTGTFAVANITTVENSPTLSYGMISATMTVTSTSTLNHIVGTSFEISDNSSLLSGTTLFFDGGGTNNTGIWENTPDSLDIKSGAGSRISIATNFNVLSGSVVLPSGGKLAMDGDIAGDTWIEEVSANNLQINSGAGGKVTVATNISITGNLNADVVAVDADRDSYMTSDGDNEIQFYTGGGERMQIDGTNVNCTPNIIAQLGVRIGADSGDNEIDDASQGSASTTLYIGNSSIDVTAPSSKYTKKNITNSNKGLSEIIQLDVKEYKYDQTIVADGDKVHTGLIAEDVLKICPDAVFTRTDGFIAVDMKKLIPYMVKAIQELEKRVADLENK